jgi:hypothetical protein
MGTTSLLTSLLFDCERNENTEKLLSFSSAIAGIPLLGLLEGAIGAIGAATGLEGDSDTEEELDL